MRRARRILVAVIALGLVASAASGLIGQAQAQSPADFKARLDDAMTRLATYDLGGDQTPVVALDGLVAASYGKPAQRKELAARLVSVLGSNVPYGAKSTACRQLSIVGSSESVPALAALLGDEKLSHLARYALERIADPAADEALRQALGKVQGKLLVGVINSIGARRDAKAAGELAKLLGSSDVTVAKAAAGAGEDGARGRGRAGEGARHGPAGASARRGQCLRAVRRADRRDGPEERSRRDVRSGSRGGRAQAGPDRRDAWRDLLAQPGAATLVAKQLQAKDAGEFSLALFIARELPGAEVTQAYVGELPKLPPERQALLLEALSDRGDASAASAVQALMASGEPKVRMAAILALAKLGNAAMVPAIVDLAKQEGEVAQAAQTCLGRMSGKNVDEAIIAQLAQGDAKARQRVIEILGQRRTKICVPALIKASCDADQNVRLAAIKALGESASLADLAALAKALTAAKGEQETTAVESAIGSVCARTSDKDACADVLLGTLPQGTAESKAAVLRVLKQVGGNRALAAVRAAVGDANEDVRDAAIRALCNWPDESAAADLVALAKTSQDKKYKILALRGYIRLAGLSGVADARRVAICKDAMGIAERDDERKLVLGALGGIQSPAAMSMVLSHLNGPLKNEAGSAAVSVGNRLARSHAAQVVEAMQKVLAAADNKDVIKRAKELQGRLQAKK